MSPTAVAQTVPDVCREIAGHLTGTQMFGRMVPALDIVRDRPDVLTRWARDVMENGRVSEVAERSVWHHNGFAKIVVHESPSFRLRLHVWPAADGTTARRGESDPHNHRWTFGSTVLAGDGIDVDHFVIVPGGEPTHMHYQVGPQTRGLQEVGEVRLALSQRRVRDVMDVYLCTPATVHTVEPRGTDPVVTAVLTRAPTSPVSSVFRAPGDGGDPGTRPIVVDELTDALTLVGGLAF